MALYDKKTLKKHVSKKSSIIVFSKMDGTKRKMRCTLDPSLVNYDFKKDPFHDSDDHLTVWDLEKDDWRIVNVDRIISVQLNV